MLKSKLTREEANALLHAVQIALEDGHPVTAAGIIMEVYESGYNAGQGINLAARERSAERRRLAYGPFATTKKVS